jgi:protein tyrosine phosphatase (PTP) superfamily phosphohydrolase (DUF442 family)
VSGLPIHENQPKLVAAALPPANIAPPARGKIPRIAAGLLICICIGLFGWYVTDNFANWMYHFVPRRLRTVEPGRIYASGQIDKGLIRDVLLNDHIKLIISLTLNDPTDPDDVAEQATAKELGIAFARYPLAGDGTGDIHSYAGAVAALVDAQKQYEPVLVHCASGAQRSNGATFYYRVLIQHWNADDAAAEMVRNGHDRHHNPALIPYLNSHMTEISTLLVQRGAIDRVPNPLPQVHFEN